MEERWPCGLPGPPLSHTMVVPPGTVMGSGLDTTTLGTPVRGFGYELLAGMLGWRPISNSEHWLHN